MFYINCLFYCFPDSCTFLFSIHYLLVWAFLLSVLDTKMGQRALVLSLKYGIANFYYIVIFSQQQIQIVDITVHLLLELRVILASQPQFLYFLNILLIYLCFGCAGFSCCIQAFSSYKWELLPFLGAQASVCGGFSCCGAQAGSYTGCTNCSQKIQKLQLVDSRALVQQLWLTSPVAPRHVGSSWTRDQNLVPCIGRQILIHSHQGSPSVSIFLI